MRSRILRAIRSHFYKAGFIEVQTPLLARTLAPEPAIESFAVPSDRGMSFLIPSPELHMKRLLSEGFERIFQICPVFRKEEKGARHLEEFIMLEWYRAGATYLDLMTDCEVLLGLSAEAADWTGRRVEYGGFVLDLSLPFPRITVTEAFEVHAGWTPGSTPDPARFDMDLVTMVEPSLPRSRPVFLHDYPASCASLARLKPDDPAMAERVELYAGGVEIANGFTELVDPDEQERRFFEDAKARKKLGLAEYPRPDAFLKALAHVPPCAGMALGIDRLVMLMTDAKNIQEVVSFVE